MSDKKRRIQKNSTLEIKEPDITKEDPIPPGVKDERAWYDWMKMKESTILNEDFRIIETSDPHIVIDLCAGLNVIRKRTEHLPEKEREDIENRTKAMRVVMGKVASLKQKAFGVKQKGFYSSSESILDPKTGELIEYFGRFYSVDEVHKIVVDEWGYPVSKDLINRFRKRHLDKIQERQEEYKRDYSDIRLGYKKSRLEELEYLYNDRKERYQAYPNTSNYNLLLKTIKQIKEEVEIDTLRIEGNINHNIEVTLNMHVQQELFREMTINDIIIGRVAAQRNLNAAYLIERLHSSFYSKHSGFLPGDRHVYDEEIQYPSQIVYNWEKIEKLHKSGELDKAKKPVIMIEDKEKTDAEILKESLMARIKQAKGDINESQSRVDDKEENG